MSAIHICEKHNFLFSIKRGGSFESFDDLFKVCRIVRDVSF